MTTIDRPAAPPAAGPPPPSLPVSAAEAADRIAATTLAALEAFSIYLGDRLGWYRSLAVEGPATPAELAARTGTQERYAREWLEQQATAALLQFDAATGRYAITPGMAEAITDSHSLNYSSPMPMFLAGVAPHLDQLIAAYRDGGGLGWGELGASAREAQARVNRPLFEARLGTALQSVPELVRTLSRPGSHILDVGCGGGWSTIALAEAYPRAQVTGVDIDEPSIVMARQNAAGSPAAGRITFTAADAGALEEGSYDVAFAFECLHDMPYPVSVLRALRKATAPDGTVVIMDEPASDTFAPPGDETERLLYGWSLLVCLPDGMSFPDSAGTGTVMRRSVLEGYAREAGFTAVDVLPIEDFADFRFYRLRR